MFNDSIGKNIKFYRKQRGLTQDQLSEAMGLSLSGLSKVENGTNSISIENFISLCNVLDVPADFILADVNKKFRIASITQKWQYLANLDDEEFESIAKSIELVYFYKTNISGKPIVSGEVKEEAVVT